MIVRLMNACRMNILYGGHLSLEHKILSFELPVFLFQEFNLIAITAYTIRMVGLLGMVLATLTACRSGQVTRVLGWIMRREVIGTDTRETYTGDIVAAGRTVVIIRQNGPLPVLLLASCLLWRDSQRYEGFQEVRGAVTPTVIVRFLKCVI